MKLSASLRLLAAASLIWTCAACDRGPEESTSSSTSAPQTVRVSQGSDILSLDPYLYLESPTLCVLHQVFDPLTDLDANAQLKPCLAEKWESTAPTEWIFHLRQGVKFHGGQALAADDVVFSVRRALDWPLSRLRSEIQTVTGVEAINDLTVRITTKVPDAILPLRLASILIMDKESAEPLVASGNEARLASEANGTGPYRIASWTKDDRCALEANEQYWGGAPVVKRLEYLATSNDQTRMAALERNEIDILVNIPPRMVEQAERMTGYRVVKRSSMRLIYLGLDTGRDASPGVPGSPPNPLKDLRVRQAIAKAIDNRLIVEKIMAGNAAPADQLLPEGVVGYDPSIKLERPDREGAKRLLREAGYTKGFDVRLDGPNEPLRQRLSDHAGGRAAIGPGGHPRAGQRAAQGPFFHRRARRQLQLFPDRLVQHERRWRADFRESASHDRRDPRAGAGQYFDAIL